MPSSMTSAAALASLTLVMCLPLASCDEGPPPPLPMPSTPPPAVLTEADVLAAAPPPAAAAAIASDTVSKADVVGVWMIHPNSARDLAFNVMLETTIQQGIQEPLDKIEVASLPLVPELLKSGPVYTITNDGAFKVVSGTYHDTVRGKWTLDGDTLTLTAKDWKRDRTYKVTKGLLTTIPHDPRMRVIKIVPK